MTYVLLSEVRVSSRTEAEILQDKLTAIHPGRLVKVAQIKMGPKTKIVTAYMVRLYTKEKENV